MTSCHLNVKKGTAPYMASTSNTNESVGQCSMVCKTVPLIWGTTVFSPIEPPSKQNRPHHYYEVIEDKFPFKTLLQNENLTILGEIRPFLWYFYYNHPKSLPYRPAVLLERIRYFTYHFHANIQFRPLFLGGFGVIISQQIDGSIWSWRHW